MDRARFCAPRGPAVHLMCASIQPYHTSHCPQRPPLLVHGRRVGRRATIKLLIVTVYFIIPPVSPTPVRAAVVCLPTHRLPKVGAMAHVRMAPVGRPSQSRHGCHRHQRASLPHKAHGIISASRLPGPTPVGRKVRGAPTHGIMRIIRVPSLLFRMSSPPPRAVKRP